MKFRSLTHRIVEILNHNSGFILFLICVCGLISFEMWNSRRKPNLQAWLNQIEPAIQSRTAREQFAVGQLYLNGRVVEKNLDKALRYLKLADQNGYSAAALTLVYVYYDQLQDYPKAFFYNQKAIQKGYADAYYNLGIMYKHGHYVSENPSKAFTSFVKAASMGSGKAYYHLASFYNHDIDPLYSPDKVLLCLKKAAQLNEPCSCYWIANIYAKGTFVAKDADKACEYYNKALCFGVQQAYPKFVELAVEGSLGDGQMADVYAWHWVANAQEWPVHIDANMLQRLDLKLTEHQRHEGVKRGTWLLRNLQNQNM